jgi:hypothetical protein
MTPIKKKYLSITGINYKLQRLGGGRLEIYVEKTDRYLNLSGGVRVRRSWDHVSQDYEIKRIMERVTLEAAGLTDHAEIVWLDSDPLKVA